MKTANKRALPTPSRRQHPGAAPGQDCAAKPPTRNAGTDPVATPPDSRQVTSPHQTLIGLIVPAILVVMGVVTFILGNTSLAIVTVALAEILRAWDDVDVLSMLRAHRRRDDD